MAEIDRDALDAQTGGDSDLAREVLVLFAGECNRLVQGLTDAALPALRRAEIAHTLRGSAAGIGAGRVQARAGTAEACLRAGSPEAGEAVAALAEAVAAAVAEIEAGA
ncbi:Hpt domain-containing protein [Methylobacterium sp. J-076]|uniref:Hpt domain-containing protein n=1 Tax=Methylobacterium sp. J-076 TaxID=2836655 RepID=UPI001FBAE257|nr:Hpt domain-containing protein [Methylobacterium sp. J-076]MCJ2014389.1 Hpt domain-containing protein [Methylobacterium sp. J-076]